MTQEPPKGALQISVKSPQQVHFEGWATAITSVNKKGKFDVLGYHANFITIITQFLTIHLENNVKKNIPIQQGVLKVSKNTVRIFLGIDKTSK